jgi:hypothetical protein
MLEDLSLFVLEIEGLSGCWDVGGSIADKLNRWGWGKGCLGLGLLHCTCSTPLIQNLR